MSRNFELLQRLELDRCSSAFPRITPAAQEESASQFSSQLSDDVRTCSPQKQIAIRPEVDAMVQRLFLLSPLERPRVIAISEVGAERHRTSVATEMAHSLARSQTSVCLVDANPDSPGSHEQLGIDNSAGFYDFLRRPSDPMRSFVRAFPASTLSVMTTGSRPQPSCPQSDILSACLGKLRSEFNYVLIDVPDLESDPIGLLALVLTDGVVLVLQAHSTRRDSASKAIQEIKRANGRVLGAVLNDRTFPIPDAIYKRF